MDPPTEQGPHIFGESRERVSGFIRVDPTAAPRLRCAMVGRSFGSTGDASSENILPEALFPTVCYLEPDPGTDQDRLSSDKSLLPFDEASKWENGTFLFFDAPPADPSKCVELLENHLLKELSSWKNASRVSVSCRLVWIRTDALGKSPPWDIVLPTPKKAKLGVRNWSLSFPKRTSVEFEPKLASFGGAPGFRIAASGKAGIRLSADAGDEGAFRQDVKAVHLALCPPVDLESHGQDVAGSFRFPLELGPDTGLDVGLRVFRPGGLASLRYPVFDVPPDGLPLTVTLDPFRPLDPRRTYLEFREAREARNDETPSIPSFYRCTLGEPVGLTPWRTARLVFHEKLNEPADDGDASLYLVPHGPFDLTVPGGPRNLLLGLSGTEDLPLTAASCTLHFHSGMPACAEGNGERLTRAATTAWVSVSGSEELAYRAQPAKAALHGGPPEALGTYLPYHPVRAASLPPHGDAQPPTPPGEPFPVFPYAGVRTDDPSAFAKLERDVLSPERRSVLSANYQSADQDATAVALTPGGLLAEFQKGRKDWSLTLAKGHDAKGELGFDEISGDLAAGLLSDPQFLVIADRRSIEKHFTRNEISIEGWTIFADPAEWESRGTMIVIKNVPGRSVFELARDTAAWTGKESLSGRVSATRDRLVRILEEAGAEPRDEELAAFSTRMNDPDWNGVLFLDCGVKSDSNHLPEALRGLAGGMDTTLLSAHHLGISHSAISREPGLAISESSLFGLIDYPPRAGAPTLRADAYGDFGFTVRSLRVRFEDSRIRSFSSSIDFTIRRLFGVPVTSESGNDIALVGSLQRRGGRDTYVFSTEKDVVFRPDADADRVSPILRSVTIVSAEYATVEQRPAKKNGDPARIVSRFDAKGHLCFADLGSGMIEEGFDLFGYEKLAFDGLGVEMTFAEESPRDRSFRLDLSRMRFDPARSVARGGSLPAELPLKPVALVASANGNPPTGLGFESMRTTPMTLQSLSGPWYGLEFELDMGTMGALANCMGLTGGMLLAWSPTGPPKALFTGFRLPGITGKARLIQIEGVIQIAVTRIEMRRKDGQYTIWLRGVGVSFFGFRLPRGRSIDVTLFPGRADGESPPVLAWYGRYLAPSEDADKSDDTNRDRSREGKPR